MASTLRSFANTNARLKPTVGDTKTNALDTDHMGWLKCDGRELNTSDYAHLFSVIGYSFGGSGSTFQLPEPRGRVLGVVGEADAPGPTNTWILGDISGEETHLLTLPEVPAHNHNFSTGSPGANTTANGFTDVSGNHNHGGNTGAEGSAPESETAASGGGVNVAGSNTHTHTISTDGAHSHRIASNGGDQRHNNIQPTMWIGNLFIYGGRPWVGTPNSRALQGPAPQTNNYPPQGPIINLY